MSRYIKRVAYVLSHIFIPLLAFSNTVASASEVKTSSLAINKIVTTKLPISHQCKQLFQETDKLIAEAEKQPGTHTQMKKIKNKLIVSKQQILTMETAMQEKSCQKGLIALNNLKQKPNNL